MNESLEQFRKWCLDAFAFLRQQYGFFEVKANGGRFNPYCVRFSNGEIELGVKGEGYGTIAYIYYVSRDGIEVPSQFLEPGWEPSSFRRKRKGKGPRPSQEEQIFSEANRIKERDGDILRGDYSRLEGVAARWKNIKEKLFGPRA
jgi:hypothetical protein